MQNVTNQLSYRKPVDLTPITQRGGFDYSAIDSVSATEAKQAADRIRHRQRALVGAAIEIGKELIRVKPLLGRGPFGRWLDAEFAWSDRTARRFMRLAEVFGEKADTVSELPPGVVYRLAAPSTPKAIRDDIVTRIESGQKIGPTYIVNCIDDARVRERTAKLEAKLTPKQRAKRREEQERHKQLQEEAECRRQRQADAERRADQFLIAQLGRAGIEEYLLLLEAADDCRRCQLAEAAGIDLAADAEWRQGARSRLDVGAT